jgi:hypothetical protein
MTMNGDKEIRAKEIEIILDSLVVSLRDDLNDELLGNPTIRQCRHIIKKADEISMYVKQIEGLKLFSKA